MSIVRSNVNYVRDQIEAKIGSKPFFLHRLLVSELQVVCSVWGPLDLPVGETGTVLLPQGGARRAGGRFEI